MNPIGAVLCLRPERDFDQVGVKVPEDLSVTFEEDESAVDEIGPDVRCLVLPSAGPALAPEMFRGATGLELVQYTGAGIDRIADSVLSELGCAVCNIPGASAPDVAAYVVIATGLLLRRVLVGDHLVKAGRYGEARSQMVPALVRGFRGLQVGVIGFGGIGSEVAKAFQVLGAKVRWFDPAPAAPDATAEFERSSLDELLAQSEVITLHVPLVDATRGLIDATALAKLPKGAIVVNASRGGIIDEAALGAALESGHLGGVALDVYEQEPLPADSPLLSLAARHGERMLMTPHIAGVTPEASRVLFERAWHNVHAVLVEGHDPQNRLR
ncbi:MAG: NAD(P)-dependent oxidoreductase [Acidimicrobiales bacterium]